MLERAGLGIVFGGDCRLLRAAREIRNGARIGEHVTVQRRAIAVATDGFLHGVAGIDLPVQANGGIEMVVPRFVIGDEIGEQIRAEFRVAGGLLLPIERSTQMESYSCAGFASGLPQNRA